VAGTYNLTPGADVWLDDMLTNTSAGDPLNVPGLTGVTRVAMLERVNHRAKAWPAGFRSGSLRVRVA
jgi:hypothetical protein